MTLTPAGVDACTGTMAEAGVDGAQEVDVIEAALTHR
jgi:hypothetical protein